MNDKDLREGFEAWANDEWHATRRQYVGGPYDSGEMEVAWESWQASRQHGGHADFVRKIQLMCLARFYSYKERCELVGALCAAELAKAQS